MTQQEAVRVALRYVCGDYVASTGRFLNQLYIISLSTLSSRALDLSLYWAEVSQRTD